MPQLWEIVGGADKGGILVREKKSQNSAQLPSRLATGAAVEEIELVSDRLHYRKRYGAGPDEGWIGIKIGDKVLAQQMDERKVERLERKLMEEEARMNEDGSQTAQTAEEGGHGEVGSSTALISEYEAAWVAESRRKLEALRQGAAMDCPPPAQPPKRIESGALTKLPPWARMEKDNFVQVCKQNLPGHWSGLKFPHCTEQLRTFGPDWFTEAFHKFGTLPVDNSVIEVSAVEQLPMSGFDTAGGSGPKAMFNVKYATPDSNLHSQLFAKMPYEPFESEDSFGRRIGFSAFSDGETVELSTNVFCEHLFPFRIPKVYFCDLCRETTNSVLITERIPFSKRGLIVNGKPEVVDRKPFEVLPSCGKYQDYLLEDPAGIYYRIFRTMAELAGWDNIGRFDSFLGPKQRYTAEEFLRNRGPLKPKPVKMGDARTRGAISYLNQGIAFATEVAPHLFSSSVRDPKMTAKMQEDFGAIARHCDDIKSFMDNSSDYVTAAHFNMQSDNVFFWKDENGDLDCGVLDWAGFGRQAFVKTFMGCLRSAETDILEEHEEGLMQAFCTEYVRYGGPSLDWQDLLMRHRLMYITFMLEVCQFVDKEILRETPKDEWKDIKSVRSDTMMNRWQTRCRGTALIRAFEFWPRRDFRKIFDDWKDEAGQLYITTYQ
mmetsp:Transcript_116805/g.260884  ORF Transcript_116805/g.260884 Transcript_116805/m.260884 type:complete len:659 (-) Transcript_116805:90-2066(-)